MLVFDMSKINVLYTFDTNFWQMALVSMHSLMCNKAADTDVTVYCMVAPHTRGYRRIKRIVTSRGGKLVWRVIRDKENPFQNHDYLRWSPVIFYRLFAHNIFPHLDKFLYLDSDTIVRSDLTELFNTDISKYAIGAIRDMSPVSVKGDPFGEYIINFNKKYKPRQPKLYVNSGVLLINTEKMRECDSDLRISPVGLKYPDQDILNIALDGKMRELPLKYNCVPVKTIDASFPKRFVHKSDDDIVIAHFYAVKPYIYAIVPREVYSLFFQYADEIGVSPEKLEREAFKRSAKHSSKNMGNRTYIPFLRTDRRGYLRLFGIRV